MADREIILDKQDRHLCTGQNLHTLYSDHVEIDGPRRLRHSIWFNQQNDGYTPSLAGDNFWQHNFFVGYRFPQRYVEVLAGVLNLTDTDYRLNPLNVHPALRRERTFVASLKFNF